MAVSKGVMVFLRVSASTTGFGVVELSTAKLCSFISSNGGPGATPGDNALRGPPGGWRPLAKIIHAHSRLAVSVPFGRPNGLPLSRRAVCGLQRLVRSHRVSWRNPRHTQTIIYTPASPTSQIVNGASSAKIARICPGEAPDPDQSLRGFWLLNSGKLGLTSVSSLVVI